MKRKTKDEFISDAIKIHGDKFDYSKVNYINTNTKVCVIDKIYGEFWVTPHNHLKGQCHPEERRANQKSKLVFGVGINDMDCYVRVSGKEDRCYRVWRSMLERCYSARWKRLYPTYEDCVVCEDWKTYSQFKRWFDENYIVGYDLDKDLFSKGEKIYSPEYCTFLPPQINKMLISNYRKNGRKVGVYKSSKNRYVATINTNKKLIHLGCFVNEDDAHFAYVKARREYIKSVAKEFYYSGKISRKVYEALLDFNIPEY